MIAKLNQMLDGALVRLDTLDIELTLRCPLRCAHCSAFATPERREELVPAALCRAVAQHGAFRELYLSGGEPFTHRSFLEIVRTLRPDTEILVAYSSGTVDRSGGLVGPIPARTLRAALRAGLDRIDVSIYAGTATWHDQVTRRPGSFVATVETIRRAASVGLPVGIHTVPLGSAAGRGLMEVCGLARELGAVRLHVLGLAAQGRAAGGRAWLSPDRELPEVVRDLYVRTDSSWLVLSRDLRHQVGVTAPTVRDTWRCGFLTATGRLAPGEGRRGQLSTFSILDGCSLEVLAGELTWS